MARTSQQSLMRIIDEQYLRTPFFGSRQMTDWLRLNGHQVKRKRIQRLMCIMGLEGTVPGPHTSKPHPKNKVYPYLLRGLVLRHSNLVWSADITVIPMPVGFMYLVAIIDWYSRYALTWRLSNTIDTPFCLEALDHALSHAHPCIFNSDQGRQFTSVDFTGRLLENQILISMDGRSRALDNVLLNDSGAASSTRISICVNMALYQHSNRG
ncbi:transposase [endosymbiont of Riftia pachyptila (vent Ph05)]|uniref:Transposase n=2 Tax=Gammaproteobacteria TaxID=1236 RepID=G2DFN2_9GAMM|nr:transposase [endosymbiont of Riftia pachyptila (vent Ph05)]